jgi:hypothetical protein
MPSSTRRASEEDAVPKDIKGNVGRKPPEPAPNHDDIDDWITQQMRGLQGIVTQLDTLIRATIPDLHYAVKRKRAYYGLAKFGWVIELAAYDVSVNVLFLGGADFDAPPALGTVDRTRYVKVTSLVEVQGPEMRRWVEQAGCTAGWTSS